MTGLIVSGAVVIVGLSAVAIYYHWLLHRQRHAERAQAVLKAEKQQKNRHSVYIIAKALLEDQVTSTEASIRVSVLLQACELSDEELAEYSVFYQLAQATSHIPILDAWKALSRSEKKRFDTERVALEEKYRDFIVPAARKLVQRFHA